MIKQLIAAASLSAFGTVAMAQNGVAYQVSITNLTPGQTFTPRIVIAHDADFRIFIPGAPASEALEIMAEGGDVGPMADAAANSASDIQIGDGLLGPGETSSVVVMGRPGRDFISTAAMLIPTNDTFMALSHVRLPPRGTIKHMVPAYDAGTEENDQSCQHIPGPRCGGEGYNSEPSDGDEGRVHIGNGFHDLGEEDADGYEVLGPKTYDWRNSVAKIVVRRMN